MTTETQVQVQKLSIAELTTLVFALQARIEVLETPKPKSNGSPREMTDDDARKVILSDIKHQKMADELGLSYGQVYSCRLGFTFKHIHKEMKEQGKKNAWIK